MQQKLAPDIKEIIKKIPFLPTVTIVMPFNPKMNSGSHIDQAVKLVRKGVTDLVLEQYNDDLGIVVLQKLARILKTLNTGTPYESIAIYISPVFDKVLYLNFPVQTYVSIDESFSIHQVIHAKRNPIRYLVLNLQELPGKLFYGSADGIFLIKTNYSASFYQTDKDLNLLMQAYNVPVFVLGSQETLENFHHLTQNDNYIVKYVVCNAANSLRKIFSLISIYFPEWRLINSQYALKQLATAKESGLLEVGLKNIYEAIKVRKPQKLVIKHSFLNGYFTVKDAWNKESPEKYHNKFSYVKNNLDEIIEKVLEEGGDIELIDDAETTGIQNISLIYK